MQTSREETHEALSSIALTDMGIALEKEKRAHQETKKELENFKAIMRTFGQELSKLDLGPKKEEGKVWGKE